MASNNMTNNATCLNNQYACFPFIGVQGRNPAKTTYLPLDSVPSIFSETSTDSTVSPHWNSMADVHLPIKPFVDFEQSSSNEDTDSVSSSSNLLTSSRKIVKSPQLQNKNTRRRPNRRRNDWKPQEDAKLLELMKEYGQCWAMISSKLPGRTGKQVRDRYVNNLAPGIRCGNWTPEEDQLILNLRSENGNKWSFIASYLPGRTEAQVKNRFYSCIKKKSTSIQSDASYNQAYFYQELETVSSPITSPEIEIDFEEETVEAAPVFETSIAPEQAFFSMGDVDSQSARQTSSCLTTNVPSLSAVDEDKLCYGNIIRIPCFTGRPECLKEPLANPFAVKSDPSSKKPCSVQSQLTGLFNQYAIQNDSQIDDLLNHAVDCVENCDPYDIEKYFAEDLKEGDEDLQMVFGLESQHSEREMELRRRKAYLESMLQSVVKEMQELKTI